MVAFDKLKALFNLEVNSPIVSINITKNSHNPIDKKEFLYDKTNDKLELYLGDMSDEKREKLKEILKEYIGEENKLLEKETSKLLYKLYKYNKENKNIQLLSFFKPIIPREDLEALESSLYLREVFQSGFGEDIGKLKYDIIKRFGDRGNNISNLCTAGYFEQFLMPLYNSSKERFKELYDIIVDKSVVAVFVHSQMEQEDIPKEITTKLRISSKYGIKFIHIHGIGSGNIFKIKECLRYEKQFFKFFEKEIYEKDNLIIVELLLH